MREFKIDRRGDINFAVNSGQAIIFFCCILAMDTADSLPLAQYHGNTAPRSLSSEIIAMGNLSCSVTTDEQNQATHLAGTAFIMYVA